MQLFSFLYWFSEWTLLSLEECRMFPLLTDLFVQSYKLDMDGTSFGDFWENPTKVSPRDDPVFLLDNLKVPIGGDS